MFSDVKYDAELMDNIGLKHLFTNDPNLTFEIYR